MGAESSRRPTLLVNITADYAVRGHTEALSYSEAPEPYYSGDPCLDDDPSDRPAADEPPPAATAAFCTASEPVDDGCGRRRREDPPSNVVPMIPGHRRIPASEILTSFGVPVDRAFARSLRPNRTAVLDRQRGFVGRRGDPLPTVERPERG